MLLQLEVRALILKRTKERIDAGTAPVMIDVREPHEWEMDNLSQARKISLGEIPAKLQELKEELQEQEVVLICRSGGRSGRVTQYFSQQGFSNPRNLAGGMLAWKDAIDPSFDVM